MSRAVQARLSAFLGGASVAAVVALVVLAGVVSAGTGRGQEEVFPHEAHAGLFPVCTGCHTEDGLSGAPGYPDAALCAQCHEGANLPPVSWSGPTDRTSNVRFDHPTHAAGLAAAGEPGQSCESCHSAAGDVRMQLDGRAREATCFACHVHAASDHFAAEGRAPAASCEACHVPLARTSFPRGRIAGLPVPADHLEPGFLAATHGTVAASEPARCATCHTEERCLACHVDVDNPVIALIPSGSRLDLPPMTAAYPVPPSHRLVHWPERHAPVDGAGSCNTCHTTEDCRSCHVEPVPSVVAGLPRSAGLTAPGVGIVATAPGTHESPFFMDAHATLAAADDRSCATCHTPAYCVDCHDAPAGGGYHPPDFVSSHAATAFGRASECASCHETAAFCRACHLDSGFGSSGRLASGYHDAEPLWLLRHGHAARQNLESCASCHEQRDCVQCHGVLGAFRVSPHGPGFDAERAWATSPRTCLACHIGNPLGGA